MQQSKGGILSMLIVGALLAGFGFWQFGNVGLGGGEFEDEEHEYREDRAWRERGEAVTGNAETLLSGIAAERGWRIVERDREREDGRVVYELKLVDEEGRRHKLVVDAQSGEVIKGGR